MRLFSFVLFHCFFVFFSVFFLSCILYDTIFFNSKGTFSNLSFFFFKFISFIYYLFLQLSFSGFAPSTLKSHSLRKSDTSQYGLEIEKIDFSETLPIFNLY